MAPLFMILSLFVLSCFKSILLLLSENISTLSYLIALLEVKTLLWTYNCYNKTTIDSLKFTYFIIYKQLHLKPLESC